MFLSDWASNPAATRMVVSRAEYDDFAAAVAKLRDDLARLEQRVARRTDPRPASSDS